MVTADVNKALALCFAEPTGLAPWRGTRWLAARGPGGRACGLGPGPGWAWAWLGLGLPAGGALGCLAGPAERQSTPLGALSSAWVEASPRAR